MLIHDKISLRVKGATRASFTGTGDDDIDGSVQDVDMVPMINVVFLLLIFFMVVGVFRTASNGSVLPPVSTQSAALLQNDDPADITLTADGSLTVAGNIVELDELFNVLSPVDPTRVVLVRADAQVDANTVAAVLSQARESGVASIGLQIVKGPSSQQQ